MLGIVSNINKVSLMKKERLKILSPSEVKELYGLPQFTDSEKTAYFSLNQKEYKLADSRGSLPSKVQFILQLGYFKATSQFFNVSFDDVQSDVDFILREHCKNKKLYVNTIAKQTRQSNQNFIAKLLGYQVDKSIVSEKLTKFLAKKSQLSSNPIYLFHEMMRYSAHNKLMLLGYSTQQDLIGELINQEEERLGKLLSKHLSSEH